MSRVQTRDREVLRVGEWVTVAKEEEGGWEGRQGKKLLKDHKVAEFSKPLAWISHRTVLAPEEETWLQTGGAPGCGWGIKNFLARPAC